MVSACLFILLTIGCIVTYSVIMLVRAVGSTCSINTLLSTVKHQSTSATLSFGATLSFVSILATDS